MWRIGLTAQKQSRPSPSPVKEQGQDHDGDAHQRQNIARSGFAAPAGQAHHRAGHR